ncbi:uncharacterized protein F5147DRAFT_770655 [Suillus discolor]|uniref:DUF6533 domain-containing protein n=1 Tax=Suillus discolor TaxID=1912936 RepID=A0A9P7FD50_9AGAM|nr:uncharacterized protein F5147DRAFT_770655 [Suillus discolor]KAG2113444.1 hypothetical protein F5147DRAFT_770655 [Suillus discolor]
MTVVSNDPTWLPWISNFKVFTYFLVVSSAVVVYDWALTFGQEFELVWRQHWSFMTVLYVCVRYIGLSYYVVLLLNILVPIIDNVRHSGHSAPMAAIPIQLLTALLHRSLIIYFISVWMPVVVNAMLGVIMMIRIYAMYGRPKKLLAFLVVILLASTIFSGVMTVMAHIGVSAEEFIIFGNYVCVTANEDTHQVDLGYESLIFTAIWEILAFILAVWIVIKHLRELRQSSTGSTIGDCFMVLIQSHAFYFAVFATVACFTLGSLSPNITYSSSVGSMLFGGVLKVAQALQMFVLGPRLILSIREYHAELVARPDEGTRMTSIHFQAGGDALTPGEGVLTGGDV